MRTLGNDIWLLDIIYISLIIIISSINIFLYVTYGRTMVTAIFHGSSLFLLISVFCSMIDNVILQLEVELIYQKCAVLFFWLFIAGIGCDCIFILFKHVKDKNHFNLPPNLEIAYSSVEDLAIILDYDNKIIKVNHADRIGLLPRNVKTLDDILENIDSSFVNPLLVRDEIKNAKDSIRYEIFMNMTNMYYSLVISPIFAGGQRVGLLILFLDITTIKQLESTLTEQNARLEQANRELANYVRVGGALEAQTERLHILENILSLLTVKIEKSKEDIRKIKSNNTGSDEYRKSVKKIADNLRDIYKEVRASVNQIAGEDG